MNTLEMREKPFGLTIHVDKSWKYDFKVNKQSYAVTLRHCRINNEEHVSVNVINADYLSGRLKFSGKFKQS